MDSEITKKLDSIRDKMKTEMKDLKTTLMNNKKELSEKIGALGVKIINIQTEGKETRKDVNKLKNRVKEMSEKIEEPEQYNRKANVIIHGIPEIDKENEKRPVHAVQNVAVKLEASLELYDNCAIHRIPTSNKDQPRPIIVRLNSRSNKISTYQKLV